MHKVRKSQQYLIANIPTSSLASVLPLSVLGRIQYGRFSILSHRFPNSSRFIRRVFLLLRSNRTRNLLTSWSHQMYRFFHTKRATAKYAQVQLRTARHSLPSNLHVLCNRMSSSSTTTFKGCSLFRQRLVTATLTGKVLAS